MGRKTRNIFVPLSVFAVLTSYHLHFGALMYWNRPTILQFQISQAIAFKIWPRVSLKDE